MSKSESNARAKRNRLASATTVEAPPERTAASASDEQRRAMIAESAYFRAAARGFQQGDPVADWLASELEVDALLANGRTAPASASQR